MKFLICSCSHGHLANKDACNDLLKFKADYKPDVTVHAGDFIDAGAFMGNGKGSETPADNIWNDISDGLEFVRRLEPNVLFCGNHEDRLWKIKESTNEVKAWAASTVIDKLESFARQIGAELVEYGSMSDPSSYRRLGPLAVGHGWSFGKNAEQEHAQMTGQPTAIGHVHRMQSMPAYGFSAPPGYSVGCLCDIPKMTYAKNRKATAGWTNGFAYGEFSETEYTLILKRIGQWKPAQIKSVV